MAARILILDDISTNRIVLKVRMSAAAYEVVQADTVPAALAIMRAGDVDLILAAAGMGGNGAQAVARAVHALPVQNRPVLLILGNANPSERLNLLETGADEVLPRTVDENFLLARMRNLLRHRRAFVDLDQRTASTRQLGFSEASTDFARTADIGIIGGTMLSSRVLRRVLQGDPGLKPRNLTAETALSAPLPDLLILSDRFEPASDLPQILAELGSRSRLTRPATLLLHDWENSTLGPLSMDLGVDDLCPADVSAPELLLRVRRLLSRRAQLLQMEAQVDKGLQMASTDPLTGLFNRRFAQAELTRVADEARASQAGYSVIVLDIDRFKSINDQHGHAAGDAVLAELGQRLQHTVGPTGMAARIGGEEFLVVLPGADLAVARRAAHQLRHQIEARPIALPDGQRLVVTASLGVAISDHCCPLTPEQAVQDADRALYLAKRDGRNQVSVFRPAA